MGYVPVTVPGIALVSGALAAAGVRFDDGFGVGTAALVRSTAYALQDASLETLQVIVVGLLTPLATGFLIVMIFDGQRWIADVSHFLGFLFGGAIEAMYVFGEHGTDTDGGEGPAISKIIGR